MEGRRNVLKGWSKVRPPTPEIRADVSSNGQQEKISRPESRAATPNYFTRPSTTPTKFDILDVYGKGTVKKEKPAEAHGVHFTSAVGTEHVLQPSTKRSAPQDFSFPTKQKHHSIVQKGCWTPSSGLTRLLGRMSREGEGSKRIHDSSRSIQREEVSPNNDAVPRKAEPRLLYLPERTAPSPSLPSPGLSEDAEGGRGGTPVLEWDSSSRGTTPATKALSPKREREKQETAAQAGESFLLYYAHRQELIAELKDLINQQLLRDRLSRKWEGEEPPQEGVGRGGLKAPVPLIPLPMKVASPSRRQKGARVSVECSSTDQVAGPGEMVFGMRRDTIEAHKVNNDDYLKRWKHAQHEKSIKDMKGVTKRLPHIPKWCDTIRPLKRMTVPLGGEFERAKTYESKRAALSKLPQSAKDQFQQRTFRSNTAGKGGDPHERRFHSLVDEEEEENVQHTIHSAENQNHGAASLEARGRLAIGQAKVRSNQEEQQRNQTLFKELLSEEQPRDIFSVRLAHLLQSIRTITLAAVQSYIYQRRLLKSVLDTQSRKRPNSPEVSRSSSFLQMSSLAIVPLSPVSDRSVRSHSPTQHHSAPQWADTLSAADSASQVNNDPALALPPDNYGKELVEVWSIDVAQILAPCPLALELVGGHTCQGEIFLETAVGSIQVQQKERSGPGARRSPVAKESTATPLGSSFRRANAKPRSHSASELRRSRRLARELQEVAM